MSPLQVQYFMLDKTFGLHPYTHRHHHGGGNSNQQQAASKRLPAASRTGPLSCQQRASTSHRQGGLGVGKNRWGLAKGGKNGIPRL